MAKKQDVIIDNQHIDNQQNQQRHPTDKIHPDHKLVYIVFFIVLFFVIALIALVKLSPIGDSAGKAINILQATCTDKQGVVTLTDGVETESSSDSCSNGVFVDYSCAANIVSKKVSKCNLGCDGTSCKTTIAPEQCSQQASYCSGNNLISFSCVSNKQMKKVVQCGNGCDAAAVVCK